VCGGAGRAGAGATAGEPRIWQGIFTAAQAARGKETFTTACLRCHGGDLTGVTGPALTGDRFYQSWGGEPVDRLFLKIRDTMPPNFGTVLDDKAKLDVVTYILQTNGFPAGANELAVGGDDLASAQILKKGQQAAVQNFSLVQTVGCLVQGQRQQLAADAHGGAALHPRGRALAAGASERASRPLGTRTFQLLSVVPFSPASHVGRRWKRAGWSTTIPRTRRSRSRRSSRPGACSRRQARRGAHQDPRRQFIEQEPGRADRRSGRSRRRSGSPSAATRC
jgi:cytochrome c5